jgi:hypothetical protein
VDVVVGFVDFELNSEQTNMFAETSGAVKLSEDLEQMLTKRTAAVRWRCTPD